jgi:thiol-disulfide isomerase/thioredoxin
MREAIRRIFNMKRILALVLPWLFVLSVLPARAIELQPGPARPAPSLVVPLVSGGMADLARLRGRVVLVNYWASWCPPCLMEMPSMDRLARGMAKRPFVLLAVNAGEPADWVKAFVLKTRPGFPVALDAGGRNMHAWGGMIMPTSFIVDKKGRIRYSVIGPKEWDAPEMVGIIAKLMAE